MAAKPSLGKRIASARKAKSYSEQQLAQRLGVTAASIKKWESGESKPRANRFSQLAGILNVPLTWLMAGTDSPAQSGAPDLKETRLIEEKLEQASQLVNQLSFLLVDLQAQARRVQRDFDSD